MENKVIVLYFSSITGILIESGSIIPLYSYPKTVNRENAWQALFDAYAAFPIETWAIVNPNNGPGESLDTNYVNGISELHSAGIKTLGYVRTDYARQNQTNVQADVDKYNNWYQTSGIFFDEMAYDDVSTKIQYYKDLDNYAKSKGFTFTVGNPGTRTAPQYFNTVDNIVIFETDTGYPSENLICSQNTNGKGLKSVSILAYNIGNLDETAVANTKSCAGYIYVTNDYGSNPWDKLPVEYLEVLFQVLSQ